MKRDTYAVRIDDLHPEGPELGDEVLRAVRGGWQTVQDLSTCGSDGWEDGDGPITFQF